MHDIVIDYDINRFEFGLVMLQNNKIGTLPLAWRWLSDRTHFSAGSMEIRHDLCKT